jgi:hypothetical protein
MGRLYIVTDKVDPVTIGALLDKEKDIIVLSVRHVKMCAMPYGCPIDLFDLKKPVAVITALAESIMWNDLFLTELVQNL